MNTPLTRTIHLMILMMFCWVEPRKVLAEGATTLATSASKTFVAIMSGDYHCQCYGSKQQGILFALFRRQQLYKSCQQFEMTLQGWTNMAPATIFLLDTI